MDRESIGSIVSKHTDGIFQNNTTILIQKLVTKYYFLHRGIILIMHETI